MNNEYIEIKLSGKNEMLQNLEKNFSTQVYDISFHSNRSTYQLQHNALQLMKNHKLFSKIIRHPLYESRSKPECDKSDKNFHCARTRSLNDEQQTAVFNIINRLVNKKNAEKNGSVPYLLFGPPGM